MIVSEKISCYITKSEEPAYFYNRKLGLKVKKVMTEYLCLPSSCENSDL